VVGHQDGSAKVVNRKTNGNIRVAPMADQLSEAIQ
jgi:hypothetical protein